MKKFSDNYLSKKITTTPSRTQSPDFLSGNRITPTENIEDLKYFQRENERHITPIKSQQKKIQINSQATTAPRYFQNNRSSAVNDNRSLTISHQIQSQPRHSHSCVPSYENNEQVLHELKCILTMINGVEVAPFEIESNEDIKRQVARLVDQNSRLKAEVHERDKNKRKFGGFDDERELKGLRKQIETNRKDYEERKQQLYRTNKTLTSQVKSLQDRARSLQRQKNKLEQILLQKQVEETNETRKSNINQKQTLSMIKQKHSGLIKTLQQNLTVEVNNRLRDYQSEIAEYKIRLDTMEERLKYHERLNQINQRLQSENTKLHREVAQFSQKELKKSSASEEEVKKLMKQNKQLESYMSLLNRQVEDLKREHKINENQIKAETQQKVEQLIFNYESSIKILKKQKFVFQNLQEDNERLKYENQRYRDESKSLEQEKDQNWQQIVKMRNQLADYTAKKLELEGKVRLCEEEIERLNRKIKNEHLNLVEHSDSLEEENRKLRTELDQKSLNYNYLQSENKDALSEIQYIKRQCQNLISQNGTLTNQLNKVQRESLKRQEELEDSLKRSSADQKDRYQNEINNLLSENRRLNKDVNHVREQNLQLQNSFKSMVEIELKQKQNKISNHELTIRNLSKIVQETEEKLYHLESICKNKNDQNDLLSNSLKLIKSQSEQKLKRNSESLEKQLQNLRKQYEDQIRRLSQLLRQKDQIQQSNILKISSKLLKFKNENLRKELEELKKMVTEGKFEKIGDQLLRLSENYERELIRSDQKTMEIEGLIKDKCALEDKVVDLEKMKLILEEKANILFGNLNILQNQLKQRKNLCDSLLNQKVLVEKENIMLKKIKLDKETIEATKAKAREISNKIDQLLAMEEQRQSNYLEASVSHSEMVSESIARKI